MNSLSDQGPAPENHAGVAGNDNLPTISMTFDDLLQKSGLDEEVLLQRIAGVLSQRTGGAFEEIDSGNAAEG